MPDYILAACANFLVTAGALWLAATFVQPWIVAALKEQAETKAAVRQLTESVNRLARANALCITALRRSDLYTWEAADATLRELEEQDAKHRHPRDPERP